MAIEETYNRGPATSLAQYYTREERIAVIAWHNQLAATHVVAKIQGTNEEIIGKCFLMCSALSPIMLAVNNH